MAPSVDSVAVADTELSNMATLNTNLDLAASKKAILAPSFDRYFRHITIEGIETYLRATGKFEKRFWLFVIFAGIAGTLVYLIPAFSQYLQYTTVLDIGYQTSDPDLRHLPNTWICRWAINYTYFYDRFSEAQSRMRVDKRVQLFARRLTTIWKEQLQSEEEFSVDTVLNYTLRYIMLAPLVDNLTWVKYAQPQLLNEVLYRGIEAMGSAWPGIRSFYEEGFLDCSSTMRECSLNGISIDCCRDSASGFHVQERKCFKIDIRREILDNPNLLKHRQPIELSMQVVADTRYFPWNIQELSPIQVSGIQVSFQRHSPSMFDQWHYIAVGTASKVNVKGTRKRRLFDCIDRYRYNEKLHIGADPLVQEYFKAMESADVYSMEYCSAARLVEAMSIRCGCVPYIDTLRPNDSVICTPAHIYACFYGAFQDTPEMAAITKDAGGVQQKDIFMTLKGLIASECAPLCDSWSHVADVFSTIMEGEEGNISTYWRNKVTVTFDPEYRVEMETLKMNYHALLASIGDGLGLILGMSFITFVQLAVWPVVALCFLRRLRRVGPLTAEDASREAA